MPVRFNDIELSRQGLIREIGLLNTSAGFIPAFSRDARNSRSGELWLSQRRRTLWFFASTSRAGSTVLVRRIAEIAVLHSAATIHRNAASSRSRSIRARGKGCRRTLARSFPDFAVLLYCVVRRPTIAPPAPDQSIHRHLFGRLTGVFFDLHVRSQCPDDVFLDLRIAALAHIVERFLLDSARCNRKMSRQSLRSTILPCSAAVSSQISQRLESR